MGEFSVLAALISGVLDAAEAVGFDRRALAADAGIDLAALEDPDSRVPLDQDIRLWSVLSRQPVGLAVGAKLGLQGLGVVGYAMRHGATVGQALQWQQRFKAVVHPGVIPEVVRRQDPAGPRVVFRHVVPPPFLAFIESIDAYAAAVVTSMQGLSGQPIDATFVTLPRPRPADAHRHEAFFACPVAWGGPAVEIGFEASVLDLPLPASDPALFGYLTKRAEQLQRDLLQDHSIAGRVRREVGELLADGEPRLETVARRLAMSTRTLHRRLDDEGTRFVDLVRQARRERAEILLGDPSLSCTEIAFLLGYADTAPFFRAFKRWTGMPPHAFRQKHHALRRA